jgi:cytochrome P450
MLFGFDLPELAYKIGHMIERWVGMNHELGMGAFISDPGITQGYSELLKMAEELEAQILAMIQLRRSSTTLGNDVLSLLLRARDENGTGMTDAELIGQAAVLFGAAHLTTANTLTWTLFLLTQHPEIGSALFDELTGVLDGDVPTLEQLEQLPLLDRVIKESMRILPASSYSQRVNAEPVQLGPFHLKSTTPIIFSPLISHRLPDLFPNPEQFLPERWLTIAPSPYAYFPFAAGPRMCLGASLAQMTLRITLPAIWQRFRLNVLEGAAIQAKVRSTMLFPTSGMPMLLSRPDASFTNSYVKGNIHEFVRLPEPARANAILKRAA